LHWYFQDTVVVVVVVELVGRLLDEVDVVVEVEVLVEDVVVVVFVSVVTEVIVTVVWVPAMQPTCLWSQHHSTFSGDQPRVSTLQSKGSCTVVVPHPRPCFAQHHAVLPLSHLSCHWSRPSKQSK
jgi:hypothetical protein